MAIDLPMQYRELGRFTDKWVLSSERERRDCRCQSTMEELDELYHAMLPHMDGIIGYLNGFPLTEMPEAEQNLFALAQAFLEVSPAVELFREPAVPDGFPWQRFEVLT